MQLASIVRLKQLSEIVELMIIYWLFHLILHIWRHHRHNKLIECLKYVALLRQIKAKESISILTRQDHLLRWTATEL